MWTILLATLLVSEIYAETSFKLLSKASFIQASQICQSINGTLLFAIDDEYKNALKSFMNDNGVETTWIDVQFETQPWMSDRNELMADQGCYRCEDLIESGCSLQSVFFANGFLVEKARACNRGTTDSPGITDNPGTTDNPGITDNPVTTDAPGTTDNPDTTDNPGTTNNPGTTDNPGTADNPGTTGTSTPIDHFCLENINPTKRVSQNNCFNRSSFYPYASVHERMKSNKSQEDWRDSVIEHGNQTLLCGAVVVDWEGKKTVTSMSCDQKLSSVCQLPAHDERLSQTTTHPTHSGQYIVQDELTWFEARNHCIGLGGDLASTVENTNHAINRTLWIYLHAFRIIQASNSEEVRVTEWDEGEPNWGNRTKSCAVVTHEGLWRSAPCKDNHAIICAIDGAGAPAAGSAVNLAIILPLVLLCGIIVIIVIAITVKIYIRNDKQRLNKARSALPNHYQVPVRISGEYDDIPDDLSENNDGIMKTAVSPATVLVENDVYHVDSPSMKHKILQEEGTTLTDNMVYHMDSLREALTDNEVYHLDSPSAKCKLAKEDGASIEDNEVYHLDSPSTKRNLLKGADTTLSDNEVYHLDSPSTKRKLLKGADTTLSDNEVYHLDSPSTERKLLKGADTTLSDNEVYHLDSPSTKRKLLKGADTTLSDNEVYHLNSPSAKRKVVEDGDAGLTDNAVYHLDSPITNRKPVREGNGYEEPAIVLQHRKGSDNSVNDSGKDVSLASSREKPTSTCGYEEPEGVNERKSTEPQVDSKSNKVQEDNSSRAGRGGYEDPVTFNESMLLAHQSNSDTELDDLPSITTPHFPAPPRPHCGGYEEPAIVMPDRTQEPTIPAPPRPHCSGYEEPAIVMPDRTQEPTIPAPPRPHCGGYEEPAIVMPDRTQEPTIPAPPRPHCGGYEEPAIVMPDRTQEPSYGSESIGPELTTGSCNPVKQQRTSPGAYPTGENGYEKPLNSMRPKKQP